MHTKRLAGIATALVFATSAAACTGNAAPKSTHTATAAVSSAAASKSAQPTPIATPSPTPTEAPSPVVVMSVCQVDSVNPRSVEFLDPLSSGVQIIPERFFTAPSPTFHSQAGCGGNLTGAEQRSAYNSTFSMLAAQWVLPGGDHGTHVGVVAASSTPDTVPAFTDLSGLTQPDNQGYGAPVLQSVPTFGPSDLLYFFQGTPGSNQLLTADPAAPTVQPQKALAPQTGYVANSIDPTDPTDSIYTLPNSSQVYGTSAPQQDVYSPDGKNIIGAGDGWIEYGKVGGKLKHTDDEVGATVLPLKWLSPTSFYAWDGQNKIFLAKIVGTRVVTEHQLLPDTDGTIIDPTISSDGATMVFMLQKPDNGELALYEAGTAVAGQPLAPLKVVALDPTTYPTILAYQVVA